MTDDFWFGEQSRVDLSALVRRANEPFFLLNTAGELVFANPSLETLLGSEFSPSLLIGKSAPSFLQRPEDLKAGETCRISRPFGPPRNVKWFALLFLSLTDVGGQEEIGVLCQVCKTEAPQQVKPSTAELISERMIRHREEQLANWGFEALPARGLAMRRVMAQLRLAINSNEPVAIVGEAGTGKASLARVLHSQTVGVKGPLLPFDCATVPHSLQPQQLIGEVPAKEEKQSSTDRSRYDELSIDARSTGGISARASAKDLVKTEEKLPFHFPKSGLLAITGPGTILLQNVGGLSLEMQDFVVQWLDRRHALTRMIATSRQPLEQLMQRGQLSEELFHRLSALPISLPLLKERRQELPDHCAWILQQWNKRTGRSVQGVEPAALSILAEYDWPGNLRELRTVIEQAAEKSAGPLIAARELPKRLRRSAEVIETTAPPNLPPLDKVLEDVERRLIGLALGQANHNKSKAAELLGISRQRLLRRLEQLGMLKSGEGQSSLADVDEAAGGS